MEYAAYVDKEIGSARKLPGTTQEEMLEGVFQDEEKIHNEESHTRSLLKGLTWRVLATMTTVSIAFVVTGEVRTAFQIGCVEFIAKIGIYYIHERIWSKIRIWSKKKKKKKHAHTHTIYIYIYIYYCMKPRHPFLHGCLCQKALYLKHIHFQYIVHVNDMLTLQHIIVN